jgi:hypothetical protein
MVKRRPTNVDTDATVEDAQQPPEATLSAVAPSKGRTKNRVAPIVAESDEPPKPKTGWE